MPSQKSSEPDTREPKRPTRKRGRERVAALLEAGATVFAEAGYDAATMTDIAARAGASIGSLYQYFPTKEDVAAELHGRLLDGFVEMLDALLKEAEGAPVERLVDNLFTRLVAFLDTNPVFIVLAERRSIDPKAKKQNRARLRGRIEALLAASTPPIPKARRTPLAAMVLSAIRMALIMKTDDDPAIRDGALAEMQAMIRAHLASAAC